MTRGASEKSRDAADAGVEVRQAEVDITPLMVMSRTINAVIVRSLADVDTTVSVPQLRPARQAWPGGPAGGSHDRRHLSLTLARPGRRSLDDVMRRREAILAGVVATMKPQDQRDLMAALENFNAAAYGLVPDTALGGSPHLLARWPGR